MHEPRFPRGRHPRHGAAGNKKFMKATSCRVRAKAAEDAERAGTGTARTPSASLLSRDEFVDLFLDDLELPDLAKRKLAEAESEGLQAGGLCDPPDRLPIFQSAAPRAGRWRAGSRCGAAS